ncbi:hypothetical protein EYB39_22460 [Pantoea agglomerans]|nr:hypothetical protein EYB39_22460 [Pantoea agglomerans]
MRGNLHVPFLGGGGAVMRCCYPTISLCPLCARSGRSGYHVAVNVEGPAYSLSSMLMIKSRGKIVSLVCMSSSIVHQ